MSEENKDVNWEEYDLGTDLGDGQAGANVKNARYLLKLEAIEKKVRGKEKKDGTPDEKAGEEYLNLRFRIMDASTDEFAGAIGEGVFDIFNLGEKAIWKLKNLIKAALPSYTGSKIPKELIGTFVTAFVFTNEFGGYENLRTKQFKSANGWTGVGYLVDENGRLESLGGKKPAASKPAASKPANGTKPANKPVTKAAEGDDEVEV